MKAIEKLIQLRKEDPSIVAIARDKGCIFPDYYKSIPSKSETLWIGYISCSTFEEIDFGTDDWEKCIVTVNDLENYEVKMTSISVQEYERLLEAEKTLQKIQKFFV